MRIWLTCLAMIGAALLPLQARAQQADPAPPAKAADADFAQISEAEHDLFSVPAKRSNCPDSTDGEIVVCAKDHTARYRVPSSIDDNPRSHEALRDGARHAPNVSSNQCDHVEEVHCKYKGYAPPPIYYIDLSKIPLPPPGSDAEKIANGEMRAP